MITSHLLREHANHGKISLVGFYKRRIRRLFPAALLVTVVTIVIAHSLFSRPRFSDTVRDGVWATLFASNWRSIQTGTNYFSANGPTSPFQHYWSLSVEEQFYVAWPVLLIVVLGVAMKLFHRRRISTRAIAALSLSVIVSAASLTLAFHQSDSTPVQAYFSTFTRIWELGLGAVVAVVVPRIRLAPVSALALSLVGLAGIAAAVVTVSGTHDFPAPLGLLPCVGAALVIAARPTRETLPNWLLTNRLSTYLGDISYSIYLTHFPIIIFLASLQPERGAIYYAVVALLIVGTSVALYHLVEDPIRKSAWLTDRSFGFRSSRQGNRRIDEVTKNGALVAGAFLSCGLVVYALGTATQSVDAGTNDGPVAKTTIIAAAQPQLAALNAQITTALAATNWPAGMNAALSSPRATADVRACANVAAVTPSNCVFGSASAAHTVYLVGDSTSVAYVEAFRKIIATVPSWKLRVAAFPGCTFADLAIKNIDNNHVTECTDHNSAVVGEIKATRPDLVVITNGYLKRRAAAGDATLSIDQWIHTLSGEIDLIKPSAGQVLILGPAPSDKEIRTCYTPVSEPSACISKITPTWGSFESAEAAAASTLKVGYVDSRPWFCSTDDSCPSFVGTTLVKLDFDHMTVAYNDVIAPAMLETLDKGGYFAP